MAGLITKENLQSYYKKDVPYRMLSRQFEADLPKFNSHGEVRAFFKDLFGDDFMITDSSGAGADKIYFYTIVHDRPSWEKGMKELQDNGRTAGLDFFMSTQDIQVFEDGSHHMVF